MAIRAHPVAGRSPPRPSTFALQQLLCERAPRSTTPNLCHFSDLQYTDHTPKKTRYRMQSLVCWDFNPRCIYTFYVLGTGARQEVTGSMITRWPIICGTQKTTVSHTLLQADHALEGITC
ncbi:hypothetical protein O6H91_10G000900 [Diphasiastrum complanatum]|uniref:Uncharacterized protein n=1 Tax=Diphasiastrum complanatum TaxID=34168 RepID=A0ACC2CDJ0_DIPCM|nr:hypothetical protein O6H91_10G000900 [Diphasiastrum complanatum]